MIFDLPCIFDLEMGMAGQFPYRWDPDGIARVGVIPLAGSPEDVRWCEVEPCYVFHPANSWDLDDGLIRVDLVRHERMFDRDRLGPSEGRPTLDRWIIDPDAGTVSEERVSDAPQEFPRHDERRIGRPNRFTWTSGFSEPGLGHAPLLHHDVTRDTTTEIDFGPSTAAHEFVHVPRDGAAHDDETDGWLMGFVSDAAAGSTDLVILAADDPFGDTVARVHLPQRVPSGFHGNWVPTP